MKELKVRILHPPSVTAEEVKAALRGAERFRAYGVVCDHADVTLKSALLDVKNGRRVRELVTSPEPVVHFCDLGFGVWEAFFPKSVLPLGLTPSRMREAVDESEAYKLEPRLGIARANEGALVSLSRIRESATGGSPHRSEPDTALKAIEMAVVHELGHVLGRKDHCARQGCVMQGNENYLDFIERFVRKGVDLCWECSSMISSSISMRMR